jgi:hypothetical protein
MDLKRLIIIGKKEENTIEVLEEKTICVGEANCCDIIKNKVILQTRKFGSLANKAFWINTLDFDWHIGKDMDGSSILMPVRKEVV